MLRWPQTCVSKTNRPHLSNPAPEGEVPGASSQLKGKHNSEQGINIVCIVSLHNIDMLEQESRTTHGWLVCTTDIVFLKKP